jgi:hypothetical protein
MSSTAMLDLHENSHRLQTSERLRTVNESLRNRYSLFGLTTATAMKRSSNPNFLTRHARVKKLSQVNNAFAKHSLDYLPYRHKEDRYYIQRNTRMI